MIHQWERKVITEPRPKDLNKGGFTPLLYAAREGCVECARALIEAKADPDFGDPDGVTPLNMALLNQHYTFASYLIKAGADLDKWDLFGRSPVYMAADVSTLPVMGNGAVVTIPSEDKISALDVARQLLEAGANPNIQLKRRPPYRNVPQDRGGDGILAQGATPLLRASRAGDAKFVELLLKHGALVDLPSKEGVTPLMAAAGVEFGARVTRGRNRTDEGILATMKLLIDAGANVNARSVTEPRGAFGGRGGGGGGGAAAGAAGAGAAAPATGTVVGDSAAARAQAAVGFGRRGSQMPSAFAIPHQTALHGAAEHGFDKFIEFLVANGADLQAKDANGRTPLDVAKGVTGNGRGGADAFPKTVALLESLMAAKGIPTTPSK
jgi:ankyrin repeat protein